MPHISFSVLVQSLLHIPTEHISIDIWRKYLTVQSYCFDGLRSLFEVQLMKKGSLVS